MKMMFMGNDSACRSFKEIDNDLDEDDVYGKRLSVSDSLPKTAYVKMVDIWLIFAQLVPWIEVQRHLLS